MNIRSNEPFWLVKNGILHSYPSLRDNRSCEVLIVGGGITGALMAHFCVEAGMEVILIDKREVANGSTSATTSMLQYEIDVPLNQLINLIGEEGAVDAYRACRDSITLLHELVKDSDTEAGFETKESIYFAAHKKDVKQLQKEFEARKKYGFDVRWLNEAALFDRYHLKSEGAILSADGASVDAFKLTHGLLHFHSKKGLRVYDKTELQETYLKDNKIFAKMQTGMEITADSVIYCTGYETQSFFPDKIVRLKSTYAMVSEAAADIDHRLAKTLFWNTDAPYLYLRSTDDGRVLVGGGDENFKNALRRDALLDKKRQQLLKHLQTFFPDLIFLDDFCWSGTFGETKDGLPYIGAHPNFPKQYFCLGFGGNGITFSVIGAKLISELLRGIQNPLLHHFRFKR